MLGLSLLGALVAPPTAAQSFTDMGEVLAPDGGGGFAGSWIGAPSVTWDYLNNQLIMIFEAYTGYSDAATTCDKGVWALGMARYSENQQGVWSWTVESTPILLPDYTDSSSADWYECVAAHPAVVFTVPGAAPDGRLQIYFKAESETNCSGTNCEYEGIARITADLDSSGALDTNGIGSPSLAIAFPVTRYGGFPRTISINGTYYIAAQLFPDIWTFTSSKPNFTSRVASLALDLSSFPTGTYPWVREEFMSPALACDGEDIELFLGSKETALDQGGNVYTVGGALARGYSSWTSDSVTFPTQMTTWFLNQASALTWSGDNDFRHFDVIKLDTGDYLVYHSVKDGSGGSSIYLEATDTNFELGVTHTPVGKVCSSP